MDRARTGQQPPLPTEGARGPRAKMTSITSPYKSQQARRKLAENAGQETPEEAKPRPTAAALPSSSITAPTGDFRNGIFDIYHSYPSTSTTSTGGAAAALTCPNGGSSIAGQARLSKPLAAAGSSIIVSGMAAGSSFSTAPVQPKFTALLPKARPGASLHTKGKVPPPPPPPHQQLEQLQELHKIITRKHGHGSIKGKETTSCSSLGKENTKQMGEVVALIGKAQQSQPTKSEEDEVLIIMERPSSHWPPPSSHWPPRLLPPSFLCSCVNPWPPVKEEEGRPAVVAAAGQTCQATDSVSSQQVFYCAQQVKTSRAFKVARHLDPQFLCDEHRELLAAHRCCPTCGVFCVTGKFMVCNKAARGTHYFHEACSVLHQGKPACPHCGYTLPHTRQIITLPRTGRQEKSFISLDSPVSLAKGLISLDSPVPPPKQCPPFHVAIIDRDYSPNYTSHPQPQNNDLATQNTEKRHPPASDSLSEDTSASQRKKARMMVTLPPANALEEPAAEPRGPSLTFQTRENAITLETVPKGLDRKKIEEACSLAQIYSSIESRQRKKGGGGGGGGLYAASLAGHLEKVVQLLVEGHDPNQVFVQHHCGTAMHAAAAGGHQEVLFLLLMAGGNLEATDEDMRTPLMETAEHSRLDCLHFLLRAGASAAAKDDEGLMALHLATKEGHLEAVKALVTAHRRAINVKDNGWWTPVVWGAEHKHTDIVKYLIDAGAVLDIPDKEGNISLHWAAFSGKVETAQVFLDSGCHIHATNLYGNTPLHIASKQDNYDCVSLFLVRGADSRVKNRQGQMALHLAQPHSSVWYLLELARLQPHLTSARRCPTAKIIHRDISRGREVLPIPCINQVDNEPAPLNFTYVTEYCQTTSLDIDRSLASVHTSCCCRDSCSSTECNCCFGQYSQDGRLAEEFLADPPQIRECNQVCQCNWNRCRNRVVQKGIRCYLQLFRTVHMGWGLRSRNHIPKGTFVCEYIGEAITDSEADRRKNDSYLFDLECIEGDVFCLDAKRYGNVSRFINHLCDPNLTPVYVFTLFQDTRFPHITFFASRDIHPFEELGFDYGEKFWAIKSKHFSCRCGSEICRTKLGQKSKS